MSFKKGSTVNFIPWNQITKGAIPQLGTNMCLCMYMWSRMQHTSSLNLQQWNILTRISFLSVPDDYRVILNATRYTVLVTTDTRDGEPVITFTVFINNTYFQLPRVVIFQIETNTNASFTFEDGEESDSLTFDPNFDPATYPVLKISKQIVYGGTQPAQAGEYGGELTVIVVNQEGTGVSPQIGVQTAVLQITITTGKISNTQTSTQWLHDGSYLSLLLTDRWWHNWCLTNSRTNGEIHHSVDHSWCSSTARANCSILYSLFVWIYMQQKTKNGHVWYRYAIVYHGG